LTSRLDDMTQKQTEHLSNIIESSVKSKKTDFNSIHDKSQNDSQLNSKTKLYLSSSESDLSIEDNAKQTQDQGNKGKATTLLKTKAVDDDDSSSESYEDDFDMNQK
jgi:hypothetical protein